MGKHADENAVELFDEDVSEAGEEAVLGDHVKVLSEDELKEKS